MIKEPPGTSTIPNGFSAKYLFPFTPTSSPLDFFRLPFEPQLKAINAIIKRFKNFFICPSTF